MESKHEQSLSTEVKKASFPIIIEIYACPKLKVKNTLNSFEKRSAMDLWGIGGISSEQEAEQSKATVVDLYRNQYLSALKDLQRNKNEYTMRYNIIKQYFQKIIKTLDLKEPLFFFDDNELRIDIGYESRALDALIRHIAISGTVMDEKTINALSFIKEGRHLDENYQDSSAKEIKSLFSKASIEFKTITPKKTVDLETKLTHNETDLIKSCLNEKRGLIIGEIHSGKSSKQFLIDNMPLFKIQGVTTLYMEHLLCHSHQKILDSYLNSPVGTPMPGELACYLKLLDSEFFIPTSATGSFFNVVRSAKENGIRIIAIDSAATYNVGVAKEWGDLGKEAELTRDRMTIMNMAMFERFKEYDDGQKYLAFVGSGHVSTYLQVPGISELLACPNIVVHELEEGIKKESMKQNVEYASDIGSIHVDNLYYRSSKAKKHKLNSRPEYSTKPLEQKVESQGKTGSKSEAPSSRSGMFWHKKIKNKEILQTEQQSRADLLQSAPKLPKEKAHSLKKALEKGAATIMFGIF